MDSINGGITHNDDLSVYPEHIVEFAKNPKQFGRMNDPTCAAYVKGPCGDEIGGWKSDHQRGYRCEKRKLD